MFPKDFVLGEQILVYGPLRGVFSHGVKFERIRLKRLSKLLGPKMGFISNNEK